MPSLDRIVGSLIFNYLLHLIFNIFILDIEKKNTSLTIK